MLTNANTSAHTNTDCDSNGYCNSDFNRNGDGYCYSDSDGNRYVYAHADRNPATYTYAEINPTTETSPHSFASPVTGRNGLVERVVLRKGAGLPRSFTLNALVIIIADWPPDICAL